MPAVSIVIPTFHRPRLLREALGDAVRQTWSDIEILVCDNGDDERSAAVVAGFDDPRIRYLPRPSNLGMKRNAILGFTQARGEFVVKLDDDDRLAPSAVATLLEPMLHRGQVSASFARFDLLDEAGVAMPEATRALEAACGRDRLAAGLHTPADALVARGTLDLCCAMIRRRCIDWDTVPDAVATAYDRHLALQAVRDNRPVWFVPQRLAGYRIHPHSDSSSALLRQLRGSLYATELALASGRHVEVDALAEQAARTAARTSRLLLRQARTREARSLLWPRWRRTPDAELTRLMLLSCLPGGLVRRIATARHEAYLRRAAGVADGGRDSGVMGRSGQDVGRTA